jgi:hypothetical protein
LIEHPLSAAMMTDGGIILFGLWVDHAKWIEAR